MIIKLENIQAQYLYILLTKIGWTSIQKVRQLKAAFLKIQSPVEEFEKEWEKLAFEINTRKEIITGYQQTGKLKENSEEIERLSAEMKWFDNDINDLKSNIVDLSLNSDDVNFIIDEIDLLLSRETIDWNWNKLSWVSGKREVETMDAVYTALENAC